MRVSELMRTPAVTCTSRSTVREVAQLMARRRVGSVVVVDDVGEVAGLVTDRDVVLRGVAEGRSGDIPVTALMTKNVVTVDPRADIADAAATMVKRGVRRLPVVDERGQIHGLVALDDLVRNLGRQTDELSDLVRSQSSSAIES